MRIGIDARLRAYRAGGISEHVSRLIEGFSALAPAEHIVVFEHRKGPRVPLGLETRRLVTPPHHRLEGWTLPLELARARLDLWHATDVVVPRRWTGPAVATVHDVAFLRRPEFLTAESRRYYEGVHDSVRRAVRIIVVSEHTRRELERLTDVDPACVRVVPNAVHPRFFAGADAVADDRALARFGLTPGYLLFVSTIEPRKNVATLLQALRILLDRGRAVTLALAGADGWRSQGVYDLADQLRLHDQARFLGRVNPDDLAALYRCAGALAHPAFDEGFGLTPLEAMAAGTPVVVSDAGSLPEVVGGHATLVPPDNAAAWADAVDRAMGERAAAPERLRSGSEWAASFSVERMATATLAVYREALAESLGAAYRDGAGRHGAGLGGSSP